MTMILDPHTGKIYSLFWGESDNFEKLRVKEITMEEARLSCKDGQDYIKIRPIKIGIAEEE